MTDKLDPQSRLDLIQYRIKRAFETLEEADYNAKASYFNTAVNRLYYAVFYAACALLLSKEIECNSHKGVKTMLSLHFVKNGILDSKYAKIFNILFQNRQSGDYEDFIYCDAELYNDLRPKSQDFIEAIKNILEV